MRTFGALFIGGVTGIMILKFLFTILFPLFGFFLGLFATAVKIIVFGAIAYFVYTLIRGRKRREAEV